MKRFDLINAPLTGTHLIEAGAGTGKTYSIASMFLRLVLESELPVDRILVLTFTRAATRELKDRVRARIVEMKTALSEGSSKDDLCRHLLEKAANNKLTTKWLWLLETALANFDNANICNFHQFCQKVIKDYAVETGGFFDAEIMSDNSAVLEQAALDYWRQSVYHQNPLTAAFIADNLKPKDLQKLAREVLNLNLTGAEEQDPMPPVKALNEKDLEQAAKNLQSQFRNLQNIWILERDEILANLNLGNLNARSYSAKILQSMPNDMEAFLNGLLPYPLPANFEKWQADFLDDKTKKGCQSPQHAFFNLCQQMGQTYANFESLAQTLLYNLKAQAAGFIVTEAQTQKKLQNKLDFNDLILMVGRAVISNPDEGLKLKLKNSFDAVMVDEFQDTDALQYRLFAELFANTRHLFFMIGDPKQAIYAFRGADVYSYFSAAQNTRSAFSLTTNWRSVPNLVHAVNHVFKSNPKAPFVVNEISFAEAVANPDKKEILTGEPLVFWYLDSRREELGARPPGKFNKDYELSDAKATEKVTRAVASEVMRLLNNSAANGLRPGDIAVLVNSNRQGRLVYKALDELKIPATINSDEKIYQTQEARELLLIIESAAQPDNLQKLKAAYTTTVLGGMADEYLALPQNENLWLNRLQKIRAWHDDFATRGFLSMFLSIMFGENSFARLLQAPDGRRKVTNFVHLAELLHAKSSELNLSLTGVARYLRRIITSGDYGNDDAGLRLETDHDVVQVVTVHKSKGLEYQVVFYPFAWEGVSFDPGGVYKYHDKNNKVGFGFENETPEFALYLRESLAERLRLLYVALTRAKQRCYVAYGRVKAQRSPRDRYETAALTYLLLGQNLDPEAAEVARHMHAEFKKPEYDDETLLAALDNLAQSAGNRIKIMHLPLGTSPADYEAPKKVADTLRQMEHKVETNWKVTSFSSLTQTTANDPYEGRDVDLDETATGETVLAELLEPPEPFSVFAMPKGAHVGNFFHDLLENTGFEEAYHTPPQELVLEKLKAYNLDTGFAPAVESLLQNLSGINLAKGQGQVCLKDVSQSFTELEFYFPLNAVTQESLRMLFAQNTNFNLPQSFSAQSQKFTFSKAYGYLKGFIDLAFCHNGRFYVLDWKSNYEGAHIEDYHRDSLLNSVAGHSYFLQYYIYTLALCQYLRLRLPNFNYGRDFGGAFYVFLRGLARAQNNNEDYGVFRDRPPLKLVNALGRLLVKGFSDFEE